MDHQHLVNMWVASHQLGFSSKVQPENTKLLMSKPLSTHQTANRSKRSARKKNQRQRRAVKNRQLAIEREELIAKRHREIDKWLESKKSEQENLEMKKLADSTLSEVKKKMHSTEKMSKLLETITKLRAVRKQKLLNQGQEVGSSKSEEIFHRSIQDLKSFIGIHYKDYQAEEKTLKVMLEDEKDERKRQDDKRKQEIQERLFKKKEKLIDQWLFGDVAIADDIKPFFNHYNQSRTNFDAFLHIRRQWDSYAAAPDNPAASSIACGWVQPSEPTSNAWKTYLSPN